jgi:hypothetical protein
MAKIILVAFIVVISAVVLGAASHPIANRTPGSCVRHGVMTSQPVILPQSRIGGHHAPIS